MTLAGPLTGTLNLRSMWLSALFSLVIASSVGVIYVKHKSRIMYSELQKLQIKKDKLHNQWSQLLLERGTWTSDLRVERVARENLGMVVPSTTEVIGP